MIISRHTINDVLNKVRIVDLVGESVSLRQRGSCYVGLCPFHSEKTPSFYVKDDSFHCFGCGVSGDIFSFVMKSQGLSFPDSVEFLANKYGISISYDNNDADKGDIKDSFLQKKLLYHINELAYRFYHDALKQAPSQVIDYVKERGIDKESYVAFGVGFAPQGWQSLYNFLKSQGITDDAMLAVGLVRRTQRGELYDTFRGRLIFPIFVEKNKIGAFGGRVIPSLANPSELDSIPKYINSSESIIYQKNKVLFGLVQALPEIKNLHSVIIVEGYMDVISLWKTGVRNVVAPCGTALTENQVQRLSRLTPKAYVLFDGDEAGRKAAARSFSIFLNSGIETKALFLDENDDPDAVARRYGSNSIRRFLDELKLKGLSLLDCFINSLLAKYGIENASEFGAALKTRLAYDLVQPLSRVKNPIERTELVKQAAFRLIIDESDLRKILSKGEKNIPKIDDAVMQNVKSFSVQKKSIAELPKLDCQLLYILLSNHIEYLEKVITQSEFRLYLDATTFKFIEEMHAIFKDENLSLEQQELSLQCLLQDYGESWQIHRKKSVLIFQDGNSDIERSYEECVHAIKKIQLLDTREKLKEQIAACNDEDERNKLLTKTIELSKKLATM